MNIVQGVGLCWYKMNAFEKNRHIDSLIHKNRICNSHVSTPVILIYNHLMTNIIEVDTIATVNETSHV